MQAVSTAFADRARYKIAQTLDENTAKFQTAILTGQGSRCARHGLHASGRG
jgi:hypothetical protein